MFYSKDIIKKGNTMLQQKSEKVILPLSNEDEETIKSMAQYVFVSQHEDLIAKHKIRPGVGIAAIQVGSPKQMFCINCSNFTEKNPKQYVLNIINPQIIKKSKELTYLPGGEGCLSVDDETQGLTPRHKEITFKAHSYDLVTKTTKPVTMTLKGYIAIVFQHEYDHLDGILYTDKLYDSLDNINPLYEIEDDEE